MITFTGLFAFTALMDINNSYFLSKLPNLYPRIPSQKTHKNYLSFVDSFLIAEGVTLPVHHEAGESFKRQALLVPYRGCWLVALGGCKIKAAA